MRREHFKNLRFKLINPHSFKNIKNKKIFSKLFNGQSYQFFLAEIIVKVVRDLNSSDKITSVTIERTFNRHSRRTKIETNRYKDINIPEIVKFEMISALENVFKNPDILADFKGEVLEYFILYIEKYRFKKKTSLLHQTKIYHEPKLQHKRKSIFTTNFVGMGCDVDIVKVEKYGEYINLIECKFNLDGNIIKFRNFNLKMIKKVNYMNTAASIISGYDNYYDEKVKITKFFASFTEITEPLPQNCLDYKVLNVQKELIKVIEEQSA